MRNGKNGRTPRKKSGDVMGNTAKTIFIVTLSVVVKIVSYLLNIVMTFLLIGVITGGIVGCAFLIYIQTYVDPVMDDLSTFTENLGRTTTIYYTAYDDRDTKSNPREVELISERLHASENRFWVSYSSMPQSLIDAFVAIEDKRFFEHNGIDVYRSGSAAMTFVTTGDSSFGGSTITQQLIKMLTGDDGHTPQRKIQEIMRAMYLEKHTSKTDILEVYLNTIPMSNGCAGVQAASNEFFNKNVSELTVLESAALAAIVKGPYTYDPINRPEKNKERRNTVLWCMYEQEMISEEEFETLVEQDLVITRPSAEASRENVKSFYTDQLISDIQKDLMEKNPGWTKEMAYTYICSGGLKIYSCMDKTIQDAMEYIFTRDEFFPKQPDGSIPYQGASVVIDPKTGDLLGIVGQRGEKVIQRGLNRASGAFRQPGSAIKPVSVYAFAMELGIVNYGSVTDDTPAEFFGNGRGWPLNLPRVYRGYSPLSLAIEISQNTVAVKTLKKITPEYSFSKLYNDLNIKSLVESEKAPNGSTRSDIDPAPLALGALTRGVSVYDLTAAYTMLANRGIYSKPRTYTRVLDGDDNEVLRKDLEQKTMISEATAAIMTKLLQRVTDTGTGAKLSMKRNIEVAGKTGTTNDNYDKWFIGYTPYYLCGVWFGFDKNTYLGEFSTNPALALFESLMDFINKPYYGPNVKKFEVPANVVYAPFCRDSGMHPGPNCSLDPRGSRTEYGYFVKGSEPTDICTVHVPVLWDTSTRSVAGPGCPSSSLKLISLIRNEEREFPIQVVVSDAQYTYREVDPYYIYPSNTKLPFYINLVPAGKYCGTSGASRPVNSFCLEHNHELTVAHAYAVPPGGTDTREPEEIPTEEPTTSDEQISETVPPPIDVTEAPTTEELTVEELTTEEISTEVPPTLNGSDDSQDATMATELD